MKEIAVYGKGGIGKSTISANLSAAFAAAGQKVLQVGCDPKHDSTRLLLHGRENQTVLDYLKHMAPDACRAEDIVAAGYRGVHCVEAGGPEPGVGCAGRGILTTFELLDRLGVRDAGYDLILYDVLGDVVCGGFAVPMRREYADQVYIVTSGEFMSIYAANNILRGLKNYDYGQCRAGGIIFNARNVEDEYDRVRRFAEAVDLPVLAEIPRDNRFAEAEKMGRCLMEAFPESAAAAQFSHLAEAIGHAPKLYPAKPLTDQQLEAVVLGRSISQEKAAAPVHFGGAQKAKKQQFFSKNLMEREPLHGCAFSGAMGIAVMVKDSVSIAHGPASCAHITYQSISSVGRNMLLERGIVMPMQTTPPIVSSEMSEGVMIFGGIEELRAKIQEVKQTSRPRVIFVLTTCPSGIIGDDVRSVTALSDENTTIVPIETDGNITGDYLQGIIEAYLAIGRGLIDPAVAPEPDTVNIVAEKMVAYVTPTNYDNISGLLQEMGIKVNCRFLYETSVDAVKNFKKGRLNLLAYGDYMGRTIRRFLEDEYDAEFLDDPFPVGFDASVRWLRQVAACFDKRAQAEAIIARYQTYYAEAMAQMKPQLAGKRLMIVTYNHDIEWILKTASDLGMEIVLVGVLNFSQDNGFSTSFADAIGELVVDYDQSRRQADIDRLKPDLLVANYTSSDLDGDLCTDTIPLCPETGFMGGVNLAKRWGDLFKLNLKEGWRRDEVLYRKYFA